MTNVDKDDLVFKVQSDLGITNIQVKFIEKGVDDPSVGDEIKEYVMPSFWMKLDENPRRILFEKDVFDSYSQNEIEGYIASSLAHVKTCDNGYFGIIENSTELHYIIETKQRQDVLDNTSNRLVNSASKQIAIEEGYLEQVYRYDRYVLKKFIHLLKKSKENYLKSLGLERPSSIDKFMNIFGQCVSSGYHASENSTYGNNLDRLSKEILFDMFADDSLIQTYHSVRELLTIKNPPEATNIKRNSNKILKLYENFVRTA